MWFSSKPLTATLALVALVALLMATGCMHDSPAETDMPWSAPASWEGTIPLPGSYMDRYQ
ncbi:MAG: hypothetical protein PHU80_09625 [Kiritimatiellae bacterium]|nr:hypothetical protein [Kiritimatiellia bacterium]